MATEGIEIPVSMKMDKFDKQINELNNKIKKEEDKKIQIDAKLNLQEQQLQDQIAKTDALADAYQRLNAVKEKVETGKALPQDFQTLQNLEAQYGSLEKIDSAFQRSMDKQDMMALKVEQTKAKQEELNNRVQEYQSKINGLTLQKHQADIDKVKNSFNDVGSSIQRTITKVGRLAIGIIGIRTAMSGLRRASSDLASYDKQYSANLEYIRFALTQAIAPVLRYIVSLAATVLSYINAILHALFGINLFSNASGEAFKRMKKNAGGVDKAVGGAAKSAKELKKQLAGFDEINMLQDENENTGGGGRRWCRRS